MVQTLDIFVILKTDTNHSASTIAIKKNGKSNVYHSAIYTVRCNFMSGETKIFCLIVRKMNIFGADKNECFK